MDERLLVAAIYDAAWRAAMVCWHLFRAREDRGEGRVDSARVSLGRACDALDSIADIRDQHYRRAKGRA